MELAAALLCLCSGLYFASVIAREALGDRAPTVQQGLFPEWLGAREALQGRSPYRQEVTDRIHFVIYGSTAGSQSINQHRFSYPVYSAFLFLPLAIVPFPVAHGLALAGCLT